MDRCPVRTLDEAERRRIGARALAGVEGGPGSSASAAAATHAPPRDPRSGGERVRTGRQADRRRSGRRAPVMPSLLPLLPELQAKLGFPAAFCVAVTAWLTTVALALGGLGMAVW